MTAKKTKEELADERTRQRAELDAAINALPGDYNDADYVVEGMRQHFGDLFTAADEALVRERVKPPGTLEKHIGEGKVGGAGVSAPGVIRPTIGRKVWFWRDGIDRSKVQPEDATVCYVHGDSMVNLRVTEHNGVSRSEVEVSLRQPNDPEWSGRFCEWMPFQKGQAAKYDGK